MFTIQLTHYRQLGPSLCFLLNSYLVFCLFCFIVRFDNLLRGNVASREKPDCRKSMSSCLYLLSISNQFDFHVGTKRRQFGIRMEHFSFWVKKIGISVHFFLNGVKFLSSCWDVNFNFYGEKMDMAMESAVHCLANDSVCLDRHVD